jgi:hypothetical protein
MKTIQAAQHIYSNVEKEQSPGGRGGFQTLFYTQANLTQTEVEEMESRLLYFPAQTGDSPVKQLFFGLSGGKQVVARIAPIAAPDQYGRGGRYLAHSLVFTPETLPRIEAAPFALLRTFPFIDTVEKALAHGQFATGNIPAVSIPLPPASLPLPLMQAWPGPEFKKLALLALRVEPQRRAREAITISGPPEAIEAALEAAFAVTPLALRPACGFDTYFYRCNLVAAYFWAIGLPVMPAAGTSFAQVDAAARRVQTDITLQPGTSYESWVLHLIERGQLAAIVEQRETAYAVAEWLDGRAHDVSILDAAAAGTIEEIFRICPNQVRAALRQKVGAQIPADLVERIVAQIYAADARPKRLYDYLRQGFQPAELLDFLRQSYAAARFAEPSRQEKSALKKLLEQEPHPLLALVLAWWTSPDKVLPQQLEQTDEASYRQFVKAVLDWKLVEPVELLVPGQIQTFIDLYLARPDIDAVAVARKLSELEEAAHLSRLTPVVPRLSRKELGRLEKLMEKHHAAPDFFQAVTAQLAALPPEKGIKGTLKSIAGFFKR